MIRKSGNHFSAEIMLNFLWCMIFLAEVDSTSADHAQRQELREITLLELFFRRRTGASGCSGTCGLRPQSDLLRRDIGVTGIAERHGFPDEVFRGADGYALTGRTLEEAPL